jgi:hypothetical protein
MAVSRGVGSYILAILGILVVIAAIFVIVKIVGADAPIKPIIQYGIELRNTNDTIKKSELISKLDELIQQADNEDLTEQWQRMTGCLGTTCPDEAYFDLVLVVVSSYETDIPESATIINLIATNKYWGDPEQIVEFSKAMTLADEQIRDLKSRSAEKVWAEIIACNAVCPERNSLFFRLIGTILQ